MTRGIGNGAWGIEAGAAQVVRPGILRTRLIPVTTMQAQPFRFLIPVARFPALRHVA